MRFCLFQYTAGRTCTEFRQSNCSGRLFIDPWIGMERSVFIEQRKRLRIIHRNVQRLYICDPLQHAHRRRIDMS